MTKPGHLEFNFIYIVQSLGADEPPTGSYLDMFATRPRVEGMSRSGLSIGAEVVDIATAADLFAFLERVCLEVETNGRSPILHLEIHGSSDQQGLVLRSFEFVPWQALMEPLTRINRATGNNLLLTLAVCHGAWLGTILSAARPAPFWAVIGPSTSEHPVVLFPAFEAFYATLLDDLDGGKAVGALFNAAAAKGKHSFSVLHGERLFANAFRRYVAEQCNPDAIERRVAAIIDEGKRRAAAGRATVTEATWVELESTIKRRMADSRPAFEEYRRRFFMIDVWPENAERFPLTYEQILDASDRA
ncbi:MAG: hypothetical protein AB7T06_26230 [Kofleriaceae bacterium]